MKKIVVVGLAGTTLDRGKGPERWENWRPSVSLCQHEDLLISRFELLYQERFSKLAALLAEDIRSVSPETDVRPSIIEFDDPWDFEGVYSALLDYTRNYAFDVENEDYLFHITTGSHVSQICMFLLTESHYFPGRLIQTSPPPRRRRMEVGEYRIIDLDLSKYDQIARRFEKASKGDISFLKSGIETRSARFNHLISRIEQVAVNSRDPILLAGPTGAGKSMLARRIYELRFARRQISGSFVEVNCATLHGESMMSALFGHVKGAFTGAVKDRAGLLRAADKGVLLLDEIGELGLDEQAMLLRAIEEKRFLPVGSDEETCSDFQLIAGTNRNLGAEVTRGRFREDLLARINLWTFNLPSLMERKEDIEPNIEYELGQFARKSGTKTSFNREALRHFLDFATGPNALWRANFRDLCGAVTRMSTLAPGGRITEAVVDEEIERLRSAWREDAGAQQEEGDVLDDLGIAGARDFDLFDRIQLEGVVRECMKADSISEAGRSLFPVSRARRGRVNDADRLRKYLARFGLSFDEIKRKVR